MEICMTRLATKEIKKMNKIRGRTKKFKVPHMSKRKKKEKRRKIRKRKGKK
jgi:hypothetical protein